MTIPRHNYKTGSPTSLKKNKCLDKKAFSGRYIFIIYVRRRRSTMVCGNLKLQNMSLSAERADIPVFVLKTAVANVKMNSDINH